MRCSRPSNAAIADLKRSLVTEFVGQAKTLSNLIEHMPEKQDEGAIVSHSSRTPMSLLNLTPQDASISALEEQMKAANKDYNEALAQAGQCRHVGNQPSAPDTPQSCCSRKSSNYTLKHWIK